MKGLNQLLEKIDHELFTAILSRQTEMVYAETRRIREEMSGAYSLYENAELEKEIKKIRQFIQAFRDSLDPEELVVYYMGTLGGFTEYLSELFAERNKKDRFTANPIKSQYYNQIICILSQKEYVQHKDLAAELGIKTSSLTRIMKSVEEEQPYIVSSSSGKYKYYCLTETGKKYYAQYINKERWKRPEDAIEELLTVTKKRLDTNQGNILVEYAAECYPYDYHITQKVQSLENSIRKKNIKEDDLTLLTFEKIGKDEAAFHPVCNIYSDVMYQAVSGLGKEEDGHRPFVKRDKIAI